MSRIPLPAHHRKILRKIFTYINQPPSQTADLTTLAGTAPSLRLGEELLMHYRHRAQKHAQNIPQPPSHKESPPSSPTTTQTTVAPPTPDLSSPPTSILDAHHHIATCTNCPLHVHRKTPLQLNATSALPIFILLDIVNWSDQLHGKFFTTPDGELLLKILQALGLTTSEVYFTTTIKCSSVEEISNQLETFSVCLNHLHTELTLLTPKLILAFGEDTYTLLTHQRDFAQVLGQKQQYQGIDIVYTHHPKELVNDPTLKKETWEHLKGFMKTIETIKRFSRT